MNNITKWLRTADEDEFIAIIANLAYIPCNRCPADDYCTDGYCPQNFRDWALKEVEEE